jgi:hypothetical protein
MMKSFCEKIIKNDLKMVPFVLLTSVCDDRPQCFLGLLLQYSVNKPSWLVPQSRHPSTIFLL